MRNQAYMQLANLSVSGHKKPIRFAQAIPAGGEITLPWMVEGDCTLENIFAKFYGSQHLLEVRVLHERRGTQIANSVIDFKGDRDYLSGDFEEVNEPVTRALQYKDYIIVKAKNNDIKENTLNVMLSIDFYGGKTRVIGG